MYTLYIDTHCEKLVLALLLNEKVLDTKELESNLHSKNTVLLLQELLNSNKITIDDLGLIIVINGPGSFTGVRIGIVMAKIIGYTKNIPIKSISYLEAMSLSFDVDCFVGIKDRNGCFIGNFNKNHELVQDYFYLKNDELASFKQKIIIDAEVDLVKIYDSIKNKKVISPHLLTPLYVKKLEVLK